MNANNVSKVLASAAVVLALSTASPSARAMTYMGDEAAMSGMPMEMATDVNPMSDMTMPSGMAMDMNETRMSPMPMVSANDMPMDAGTLA